MRSRIPSLGFWLMVLTLLLFGGTAVAQNVSPLCEAAMDHAAGHYSQCLLRADAHYARHGNATKLENSQTRCETRFDRRTRGAEKRHGVESCTAFIPQIAHRTVWYAENAAREAGGAPLVSRLYVQGSTGGSLDETQLVLSGVDLYTGWFSERPYEEIGRMSTEAFTELFSLGSPSLFALDPPNAEFICDVDGTSESYVVNLREPVLSLGNLSYSVEIIEPTIGEASFAPIRCDGEASLFIATTKPMNRCNPDELVRPEIWAALADIPCDSPATRVQAGADVTLGSTGEMPADLEPIKHAFTEEPGMCVVNVHWHLGAEHKNAGTYDIPGSDWIAEHGDRPTYGREPGNFCRGFNAADPMYTTEYDFKHCKNMHVGYTYELHWPNSNLGLCDTEWQYQTPFMDGVLCKANEFRFTPAQAVDSVFDSKTTKIGVQAQVFTVVNDPAYDYPDWDPLKGWNTALASNVAIYMGSTTSVRNGNEVCRASGGMVTWQVDRACNLISAKTFDNLCKAMKAQNVDMTADTEAQNARVTTDPAITTSVPMSQGVSMVPK